MAKGMNKKTFLAQTVAEARALLARWKDAHPTARIIVEREPVFGTAIKSVQRGHQKGPPPQHVSISIEYEE